jgi:hypothetical protein
MQIKITVAVLIVTVSGLIWALFFYTPIGEF